MAIALIPTDCVAIRMWILIATVALTMLMPVPADEDASGETYLWKPDEYPKLPTQPKYCTGSLRNPPTSICDPDTILAPDEARRLDEIIEAEQNQTACLCEPCRSAKNNWEGSKRGLLIKVALVRSIDRFMNLTYDELLENFAERTRSRWNLAPRCHHDVLVMSAITFGKVVISMGDKAALVIGRSEARTIIASAQKHFQRNDIAAGLETILVSLHREAESYDPRLGRFGLRQSHIVWILAGVLFLILIIMFIWCRLRRDSKRKTPTKNESEYRQVNQRQEA